MSIRGAGEAYSTIAGSNNDLGMPIFILEDRGVARARGPDDRSGHNSADAGAIRMEPGSTLTVSRVVFRGHVGRMGASSAASDAYDSGPPPSRSTQPNFTKIRRCTSKSGSGTTAAFFDCTLGTLTDFDDEP